VGQRAIRNGKHLVTANKELLAKQGHRLLVEAAERKLDFNFEGSVAGGIPIIQAMKIALAANRIQEVIGIVNGTAKKSTILTILLAWITTLPLAALIGAVAYWLVQQSH